MPTEPEDEGSDWFDFQGFIKSGQHIGAKPDKQPKTLGNLNVDAQPAISPHHVENGSWRLVVRGYGLVVVTMKGVHLICREHLSRLDAFGPPFP